MKQEKSNINQCNNPLVSLFFFFAVTKIKNKITNGVHKSSSMGTLGAGLVADALPERILSSMIRQFPSPSLPLAFRGTMIPSKMPETTSQDSVVGDSVASGPAFGSYTKEMKMIWISRCHNVDVSL